MKIRILLLLAIYLQFCLFGCTNPENSNVNDNEGSSKDVVSDSLIQNNETYKSIDSDVIDALNERIINEGLMQHEEILKAYAPESLEAEGNYEYKYTIKDIDEQNKEITLIETGLMDDSIEGKKVIMQLFMGENSWKVLSIKEAYKCWLGRGHQTWSSESCN